MRLMRKREKRGRKGRWERETGSYRSCHYDIQYSLLPMVTINKKQVLSPT